MEEECKSLLQKLRLEQRNLKQFLPKDKNDDSLISEAASDRTDSSSWSSPGQSSYARSRLKGLISSPPSGTDSQQSSFSQDISLGEPPRNGFKPTVYLHGNKKPQPRYYRKSLENHKPSSYISDDDTNDHESIQSKDVNSKQVMTPPKSVKVSGTFLHDLDNYLNDSNDHTLTSLNSDMYSLSQKSLHSPLSERGSSLPSTPSTAQRRHLIDRNIPVPSVLENFEYDTNASKLNYSYSTVDDDDEESFIRSRLDESPEDIFLKYDKDYKLEKRAREHSELRNERITGRSKKEEEEYTKQLKDSGNDKSYVSIIKDSVKPRSILTSPASRNSTKDKSSIKVSFKSNSFNESDCGIPVQSRLMGYDWIAALLDNETGQMDESESYFKELKEFRRSNRDECCNNFYMNNTLTFAEPKEEPIVVEALSEPKVKPYVVNERLFTEPLKKKLLENGRHEPEHDDEAQPTQGHPRYVRVSIPRSTLEKPYKVKPHRRNSFDPTDSCSLREHCLMGWENSRVSALPTASSVDINEATKGLKPKMTTTLAEAELTARTGSTQMWPFVPPQPRVDPLPTWRKNYETSVMNLSHPSSLSNSTIPGDSDSLRKSTNSLLNSTYSLMYEMERLKREREATKA